MRLLGATLLLGCASASAPAETVAPAPIEAAPAEASEPAPAQAPPSAPEPRADNPCDRLDPQVFDVTDIDARADLTDAQKEQAKREQAERRRVLFECFERAVKEKEEIDRR